MAIERVQSMIHAAQVAGRYNPRLTKIADYTIKATDVLIHVSTTAAAVTLTLPRVAEALGRTYSIMLTAVGNVLTITRPAQESANRTGDICMASIRDSVLLFSDGISWHIMAQNINMFEVSSDFISGTFDETDSPWVLNSGNDAQAIDPFVSTTQGERGTLEMDTGNADGTTANDGTQIVGEIPVQADSGGLFMEARLYIETAITTVSVFVGLTDSMSLEEAFTNATDTITSTATDACGFLYDTGATTDEWWACAVDTNVDDTGNATLGIAPVAGTYQILRLEVSADGTTIRFYIDGVLVGTLAAGGVTETVSLYPTIVACATTTTSRTIFVDYIKYGHCR